MTGDAPAPGGTDRPGAGATPVGAPVGAPSPVTHGRDDPGRLLVAARTTLRDPAALPGSTWARSTALLTRQALETALDRYWAAPAPGMEACNATTKLLCLRSYVDDPATAHLARQTWASLSRACHHHPYELAPTATELRGWIDDVRDIVAGLVPVVQQVDESASRASPFA